LDEVYMYGYHYIEFSRRTTNYACHLISLATAYIYIIS